MAKLKILYIYINNFFFTQLYLKHLWIWPRRWNATYTREVKAPKRCRKDDSYKQEDAPSINFKDKIEDTYNEVVYDDDKEELAKQIRNLCKKFDDFVNGVAVVYRSRFP